LLDLRLIRPDTLGEYLVEIREKVTRQKKGEKARVVRNHENMDGAEN
jgi:hypothetical protein